MANSNSDFARQVGRKAVPDAFDQCGGTAICLRSRVAAESFAANDTVNMGPLPAGMVRRLVLRWHSSDPVPMPHWLLRLAS